MRVDVMASLYEQSGSRPGYKLRFRDVSGRQRVLWLGDVSKRNAELVWRHTVSWMPNGNMRVVIRYGWSDRFLKLTLRPVPI